jgi:hypothetical protein
MTCESFKSGIRIEYAASIKLTQRHIVRHGFEHRQQAISRFALLLLAMPECSNFIRQLITHYIQRMTDNTDFILTRVLNFCIKLSGRNSIGSGFQLS